MALVYGLLKKYVRERGRDFCAAPKITKCVIGKNEIAIFVASKRAALNLLAKQDDFGDDIEYEICVEAGLSRGDCVDAMSCGWYNFDDNLGANSILGEVAAWDCESAPQRRLAYKGASCFSRRSSKKALPAYPPA